MNPISKHIKNWFKERHEKEVYTDEFWVSLLTIGVSCICAVCTTFLATGIPIQFIIVITFSLCFILPVLILVVYFKYWSKSANKMATEKEWAAEFKHEEFMRRSNVILSFEDSIRIERTIDKSIIMDTDN